ncbi:hypothetical protein [Sphingomonas sp. Leaf20]|uniref:hypothetical protein n=1 Tax=Sphingomonas sp. Leaf20 TaxID=1735685 RepID=UPI0012E247C2|nr:hypothetical protein [Sphingomonas sp. Leaf20]
MKTHPKAETDARSSWRNDGMTRTRVTAAIAFGILGAGVALAMPDSTPLKILGITAIGIVGGARLPETLQKRRAEQAATINKRANLTDPEKGLIRSIWTVVARGTAIERAVLVVLAIAIGIGILRTAG